MGTNPVVFDVGSFDDEPENVTYDNAVDQWLIDKEVEDVGVIVNQYLNYMDSLIDKKAGPQDDTDDDCMILDGDPDKPAAVDARVAGDESDDLQIVGQKGQVACRDYPHSRHLCANFPFNTTSHEKHCKLCHCFVCDSLAPCIYWGNGVSLSDHCHANDKNNTWKTQRNSFKELLSTPPPVKSSRPIQPTNPTQVPRLILPTNATPVPRLIQPTNATTVARLIQCTNATSVPRHTQPSIKTPVTRMVQPSVAIPVARAVQPSIATPVPRAVQTSIATPVPQAVQPSIATPVPRAVQPTNTIPFRAFSVPRNTAYEPLPRAQIQQHQRMLNPNPSPNPNCDPQTRAPHVPKKSDSLALVHSIIHSHTKFKRVYTPGSSLISSSMNRPIPNQMCASVPQKAQHPPVAVLGPQWRSVVSGIVPGSVSTYIPQSIGIDVPIQPQANVNQGMGALANTVHEKNRRYKEILAGLAAELEVADTISKSNSQMNSSQGMGVPSDLGRAAISSGTDSSVSVNTGAEANQASALYDLEGSWSSIAKV